MVTLVTLVTYVVPQAGILILDQVRGSHPDLVPTETFNAIKLAGYTVACLNSILNILIFGSLMAHIGLMD